jgi:hypothetical protein
MLNLEIQPRSHNFPFDMRHLVLLFMSAALCVFQVDAAGTPSPSLRQTTWKEINDRQVSRMNPKYKRQMASSVPSVFPTCSVAYPGTIPVARYTQVELNGSDVS